MKIIPLSEGAFSIDTTKVFVPFNKDTDDLQDRSRGSLLVEVQPFAIVTSRDILLMDTGLGFADASGIPLIHKNLMEAGIHPGEITKVLLSHLHKDHSGAISYQHPQSGTTQLCFPNAIYYVNKQEFELAMSGDTSSYQRQSFEILENNDQVVFTEASGNIDNYIRYEVTQAHSRFHQVFWIEEEGEIIFFGGDDAPQLGQMRRKFVAKYDYDGNKSRQLRELWWEQGLKENWTFLFYHDIKSPYLRRDH